MENTFTQAFPSFANKMLKQALKYAVQKAIFCPYTNNIMDIRTAILIDIEDENGKTLFCQAISPLEDRLQPVVDKMATMNPKAVVKFYSSNKKLKSELITHL